MPTKRKEGSEVEGGERGVEGVLSCEHQASRDKGIRLGLLSSYGETHIWMTCDVRNWSIDRGNVHGRSDDLAHTREG